MKTFLRWTAALTLALLLVTALAGWWLATAWHDLGPWASGSVWIDGEPVEWAGWAAFGTLMGVAGVILAVLVVVVVVPLAVLLGLGVPLLICGGGILVALLVAGVALALTLAPFIIAGLLIVWAVRAARRPRADLPSRA